MEPRPEPSDMELLETNRPPGAFERAASALLRRRGVRVAGVVALGLVAGLAIAVGPTTEEPPKAPEDTAEAADRSLRDPDSYRPPPWVLSADAGWQVIGRPKVNLESPVYVVTFRAANRSSGPRRPTDLRAVGRFEGRPGFLFTAACNGSGQAADELRPLTTGAQPGEKILVRCTDAMEYSGNRPDLLPRSLRILSVPQANEGSGPTIVYGTPATGP